MQQVNRNPQLQRALALLDDALEALGEAAERNEDDEAQEVYDRIDTDRDSLLRSIRVSEGRNPDSVEGFDDPDFEPFS